MSQRELQRVVVISSCVKGTLTCARAAKLLDLSLRHVKRAEIAESRTFGAADSRGPHPENLVSKTFSRIRH
jgi:hypothetical protein